MGIQTKVVEFGSPPLHCPDCGAHMRLFSIIPMFANRRTDEISYRCDTCKIELKRRSKRTIRPEAGTIIE
jgi:transposase-like protein